MNMHLAALRSQAQNLTTRHTNNIFSLLIFRFFLFFDNCIKLLDGSDHVEAVLEETTQKVKEREKLIQDAETQILDLHSASYSFESGLPLVQERISELEEEVKLLWAALRTANFDLHVLEDKARDAERQVKATAFEVKQMTEVVTEQWIQVQHLEQMKEFNNRRNHVPSRCTLLKLMSDIRWEVKNALSQLRSLWAAVTKYHHQLQGFIKHEMERNQITSALANSEVVFFMASALITFPVFGAWLLFSA
ncbi:hypothetical protein IGI04_036741 [Brassica rapa subsp. trilocularis]|uniref:Uncharacterized protein n=1 Tax=Brassica rapa subsp. trilocularis TaxID=1813537 RepID=A0ABQ7LHK7_BRACM|nr:hypothetical protein IGI04_036741 [Brassica rapa subsp. trilocularis]